MRKRLLIMEDDPRVLEILAFALGREGYQIIRTRDGLSGLRLAEERKPDLIVIDLPRTEPDSFGVCQGLREGGCEVPILLLLSSEEQIEELAALDPDAGYVQKPFQMGELLMRVRTGTWETDSMSGGAAERRLLFDRLEIDPEQVLVTKDGTPIELTQREFELLYFLAKEPGKVFSRAELLEQVWAYSYLGDTRNVDVCIRRLREKLEDDPAQPSIIVTKRGRGYVFIR